MRGHEFRSGGRQPRKASRGDTTAEGVGASGALRHRGLARVWVAWNDKRSGQSNIEREHETTEAVEKRPRLFSNRRRQRRGAGGGGGCGGRAGGRATEAAGRHWQSGEQQTASRAGDSGKKRINECAVNSGPGKEGREGGLRANEARAVGKERIQKKTKKKRSRRERRGEGMRCSEAVEKCAEGKVRE